MNVICQNMTMHFAILSQDAGRAAPQFIEQDKPWKSSSEVMNKWPKA
jgi:hypothetical protein